MIFIVATGQRDQQSNMKKFSSLEDLLLGDLIVVKEVHSDGDILDDAEPLNCPQVAVAGNQWHLQHIAVGDQEVPHLSSPVVVDVPDDLNGISVVSGPCN